jgi:hypothetical protein
MTARLKSHRLKGAIVAGLDEVTKMARRIAIALATVGLFTAGLSAAISAEADASHYEHNPYLNYSCKDLALAATDVSRRAEEEVGVKRDTVQKNDSGELTIFWPRAFSAKVSGKEASDLSRLKDDMISIERAAIESECQIQFDGLRPPGA